MATKKILIVEDEKSLAHTLQMKLEGAGYRTTTVSDGQEALDVLSDKGKYDLVLLDLIMPKLDGFHVMEELNKRGDKTPIIVLSILSQEQDKNRAFELGARDYFVKSYTSLADLVKLVRTFFSKQ
ncbi:response regulator [Candidatus Uhrbacteria bacterium]|nr:response regulator [Candidatus Uhrbacteria bacterium]